MLKKVLKKRNWKTMRQLGGILHNCVIGLFDVAQISCDEVVEPTPKKKRRVK